MLTVHNHSGDLMKKVPADCIFESYRGHILSVWCQVHHSASSYCATVVTAIWRGVCVMRGNWVGLRPQIASPPYRSTDPHITPDAASLTSLFISRWGILFSHPRDYTPVCTTELGRAARLSSEFSKRDVKMIALSIDCLEDHHDWAKVW